MQSEMVTSIVVGALILATIGPSTLVWSLVGLLRWGAARLASHGDGERGVPAAPLLPRDVAVVIAAHNEELVIANTIASAATQVPYSNIFVASDGSSDRTVEIARAAGATVADISPNRGKAGAIVAVLAKSDLLTRFSVILLLDADTQLRSDYLATGLPLFDSPEVVAVAGRATTVISPRPSTRAGRLLTDYRERVYVSVQYLHKYGQAAKRANAVAIVPGFASMYRTSILDSIDIDAKGLSIEDYNMTFEVHAKSLGRIAFNPSCAIAETQDPVTLKEYSAQVRRWSLGFWQTVRRHGAHLGLFWAAVGAFTLEVVISSLVLLLVLPLLLATTLAWILTDLIALGDVSAALSDSILTDISPGTVLLGLLLPDLANTLIAALLSRRRPRVTALFFPLLRILDALLCLRSLVRAFIGTSDGRWHSPSRRTFDGGAPGERLDASTLPLVHPAHERHEASAREDPELAVNPGESQLHRAL